VSREDDRLTESMQRGLRAGRPARGRFLTRSEHLIVHFQRLVLDALASAWRSARSSTAPRAPWQNPLVERLIGSIRRECLDHVLILNEAHLRRLLSGYIAYYNTTRPHQALDNHCPRPREVEPPALGRVVAIPQVGGLHHRYTRVA
jgi:transposase InsO family protein